MEERELNLEELENILGGAPKDAAERNAIKNESLYRKELIEKLKESKEELLKENELSSIRRGK